MKVIGVAFVLAIGCSTDEPAYTITVTIHDTAMAAAQDGDGPWQLLVADESGQARFDVTSGRHGLATTCDFESVSYTHTLVRWETSPRDASISCARGSNSSFQITGLTSPNASVFVGNDRVTAGPDGMYAVSVRGIGSHDVAALLSGSPARFLIERDVFVDRDVVLDLPVATAGVAMEPVTPVVRGASGPILVFADVNTRNGDYIYFGDDPTTVSMPPLATWSDGDGAAIGARAADCTRQLPASSDIPILDMPAPFTATADRGRVTWSADPAIEWEFVAWWLHTIHTGRSGTVTMFRSTDWIEAAGAGDEISLSDLGMPWKIPPLADADLVRTELYIERGDRAGDLHSCGISGDI